MITTLATTNLCVVCQLKPRAEGLPGGQSFLGGTYCRYCLSKAARNMRISEPMATGKWFWKCSPGDGCNVPLDFLAGQPGLKEDMKQFAASTNPGCVDITPLHQH